MSKIIGICLMTAAFLIFGAGNSLLGQTVSSTVNNNPEPPRNDQLVNQGLADLKTGETEARQDIVKKIEPYPAKVRQEYVINLEKILLLDDLSKIKPAQSYFIKYEDFLKDKNTGLARLLPYDKCDQGLVVNVAELERCADSLKIRGAGSFYSFRNRTNINQSGTWSDIQFADGKFIVGNKAQFGLIREIGENFDFETLNSKSEEFDFLQKYKPKNRISEIKLENEKLEKGLIDQFSSSAKLKLNSTYILRSVAYQLEPLDPFEERADIIVAFKVIAQETDGSVILLWKQIKSSASKKLKE